MATALPEDMHQEARPPVATHVAPPSGSVGRPSMHERPFIEVHLVRGPSPFGSGPGTQYDVRHHYVRRYWTALLGPTAIADLLRTVQAAKAGRRLRLPHGMSSLLTENLVVRIADHRYLVAGSVRALGPQQLSRLPALLRSEAQRYDAQRYGEGSRPNSR